MLRWSRPKERPAVPKADAAPPTAPPASPARPATTTSAATPAANLPQLLLAEGLATAEQLGRIVQKQQETGAFIGEILVEEGIFDEQSLLTFLAKHCKIPHLSLLDYLIEPPILALIPKEICLKHRLLPIDKLGRNLTVAMVNPLDAEALEQLRASCPELRIKPILCAYRHFELVREKLFPQRTTGGAVDMTASSFGLQLPKRRPAAASPAPTPAEEDELPEAIEVDAEDAPEPERTAEGVDDAEGACAGFIPGTSEPLATLADDAARESVVHRIFSAPSAPPAADHPPTASSMMQEMAAAMMDSMRATYAMLARRMHLFQGIAAEDVATIFARGMTREVEAGAGIFAKGDIGSELFVILGGSVRIHDGDRELAILSRGDTFGEMALVSKEPRSASASALSTTSMLAIDYDTITTIMPREVSVQLLINLVVTLSDRLRKANDAGGSAPAAPTQPADEISTRP